MYVPIRESSYYYTGIKKENRKNRMIELEINYGLQTLSCTWYIRRILR